MFCRILTTVACVLLVAACTQQPAGPSALSGVAPAGQATLEHEQNVPSSAIVALKHEQDVPFSGKIAGHSQFLMSNPKQCGSGYTTITDGEGNALHLGLISSHWEHCVQQGGGWIGEMVFTGANGDEIHATYDGHGAGLPPIGEPLTVSGTITITGGTGRFAHATGSAEYTGRLTFEGFEDFDWPGEWQWKGRITY